MAGFSGTPYVMCKTLAGDIGLMQPGEVVESEGGRRFLVSETMPSESEFVTLLTPEEFYDLRR